MPPVRSLFPNGQSVTHPYIECLDLVLTLKPTCGRLFNEFEECDFARTGSIATEKVRVPFLNHFLI